MHMPRIPVRYAQRMPSIAAELRAQLDLTTYVRLLHEAAMTGQLPIYHVSGRPTGNFMALNADQRIELMRFFINKVVPDPPRETHITNVTPDQIAHDPSSVVEMSTAELLRIVNEPT